MENSEHAPRSVISRLSDYHGQVKFKKSSVVTGIGLQFFYFINGKKCIRKKT